MATILDAASSAARLSQTLGTLYQPQLAVTDIGRGIETQVAKMARDLDMARAAAVPRLAVTDIGRGIETQVAKMARDLARVYQSQIAISQVAIPGTGKAIESLLASLPVSEDFELNSINIETAINAADQQLQKLSDREVAAMVTVIAFIFTYFSLALLVKYNAEVEAIATTDGPTPFEVAMAIGALVFGLCMNHLGRTKDK